jgi:hypothetical protein
MKGATLALILGLLSFTAGAVDDQLDVPAVPRDSDWAFVHQTESGLRTYIAKASLKVLPDRSGFAVWLKLMRQEESSMAPMAAYMLHDCENPRRMRLNQAVNLRTQARSAEGKSAWLPDVPISTAIKQSFCPKISKLKAQEERDRAPVSVLANSTIK